MLLASYRVMTIFISKLSPFEYGPDKMALFGTKKPSFVLTNSCDVRSLVGVTCDKRKMVKSSKVGRKCVEVSYSLDPKWQSYAGTKLLFEFL